MTLSVIKKNRTGIVTENQKPSESPVGDDAELLTYTLNVTRSVALGDLEKTLSAIWEELRSDTASSSAAKREGVPIEEIDFTTDVPFLVTQQSEGLDAITTFVVSVSAPLTIRYSKKVLDLLWKLYFEPKLRRALQNRLKRK